MCIMAPKRRTATRKEMTMVELMMVANFSNVVISPPNRKAPDPRVVSVPLMIDLPMC